MRIIKLFNIVLFLFAVTSVYAGNDNSELEKLKAKTEVYLKRVEAQPDWLYSRLQMFWDTHATDVFVKAETFDHPGGAHAPFATVKFNGTRSTETFYDRPAIKDIVPYDDDSLGNVTYINKSTGEMEKTSPAKTGCNIATLNRQILGIARDAAKIYKATGDGRYAKMALGVFDVFMKGIYCRNVPIDLTNGHMQTLVGMTTFEVIHEDAVNETTEIYSLLKDYIKDNRDIYDGAFRKWAENIIANGVPHNNWDLFQAEFIARIAMVLQDNDRYADHHGKQYYLNYIQNESSVRQWSMKKLTDFGFDKNTGIWYESPGYSTTVLNEFADFANTLDRDAGVDMLKTLPILKKAFLAAPQYLFPNRMIAGFGDTHPSYLKTTMADEVMEYAARHNDKPLEAEFGSLKNAILPDAPDEKVGMYVSNNFYAPNVSWLVQRSGMNRKHDLMVSLNGSLGNHQHANGISMELYGKGYVLGPDAGIGKYLYSGADYNEYYSQFPAHNTVCVDGISSYPVMKSSHAFKLENRFPETNETGSFYPVTYSQLSFVEPESQSRQLRINGIVKTSWTGGYYIDIFRSRKMQGGDKIHDYFYHDLGQKMTLTAADGKSIALNTTDEIAFAGGHLYAYSYIYDTQGAYYAGDVKATFTTNDDIKMTMWMKGDRNRMVVKALSPVNMEYERMPNQPYDIVSQPVLTYIARQKGEAWNHPFVAVFEPSDNAEPSEIKSVEYFSPECSDISAVGIKVILKNGRIDYIFSNTDGSEMRYKKMKVKGCYAVVSDKFSLIENKYTEK